MLKGCINVTQHAKWITGTVVYKIGNINPIIMNKMPRYVQTVTNNLSCAVMNIK